MVRYVENCGRDRVPASASHFGASRWLLPLLCGRSERRRFIPKAAVDGSLVYRPSRAPQHVRYMGHYGRFRRAEIGRKSAITAITKNYAITSARFTESEPDLSAIAGPTRHILAVDRLPRLAHIVVCPQIHLLVIDTAPQPLGEYIKCLPDERPNPSSLRCYRRRLRRFCFRGRSSRPYCRAGYRRRHGAGQHRRHSARARLRRTLSCD
jgi:hypothetical protein